MKKEINELLQAQSASLKLNPFCTLRRWQKIAVFDERTDALEASFSFGVNSDGPAVRIESRDVDGIIREVLAAQANAVKELGEALEKDLRAGYIYGFKVQSFGNGN